MTDAPDLLVKAVRAGCEAGFRVTQKAQKCGYPYECTCRLMPLGVKAIARVILSEPPSDEMANEWCKLAVERVKRRIANDDDCPGMIEGAKESYTAMSRQRARDMGVDDE